MRINFYKGKHEKYFTRSRPKLDDFAGKLGGLLEIFSVFFVLIIEPYNKLGLYSSLANKIFDFYDKNTAKKKKISITTRDYLNHLLP